MDTSPQALISLYDQLWADSSGMFTLWDEVGRMTITRKVSALTAAISRTAHASDTFTPLDAAILNSCAVEAVSVNAAGCNSWITPHDGKWFKYEPHHAFQKDSVMSWTSQCTEIALLFLSGSNFYTKVHELYIDRVTFGTTVLTAEQGKNAPLNFRVFDPGSFIIQDNEEGNSDMLWRMRQMTNRAAMEKFGDKAPATVKEQAKEKPQDLRKYLQVVYPRSDEDQASGKGNKGMPFAECWLDYQERAKLTESGFEEIPFFANRYLRWSEFSPWGVSPAMQTLPDVRGVNYMDLLQSCLGEVNLNPRIILPQGFSGVPDIRAGGTTLGGRTPKEHPVEWLTGGRFDIGEAIIERKERMIRGLFHVPLFEQFASIERQITAAEVHAREAEKVARFSPAFTQLTTELLNPLLQRVFMLLFRQGAFPRPPAEAVYQDAAGVTRLAFPKVVQTSRMALAIASLRQSAFANWMGIMLPLAEAGLPVLDNLDPDASSRDLALNGGMPATYLRESEVVEEIRTKRDQAAQAANQQAMAMEMLKSQPIAKAGVKAMTGEEAA